MINSEVTASITHTKLTPTPNNIQILPLIGSNLSKFFWGGITIPVIIQAYSDDIPVHYGSLTTPIISNTDFSVVNLENVTPLSATNWDMSDLPCVDMELSCMVADLTLELDGFDILSSFDECDILTEYSIPKTQTGDIEIESTFNGTIITGTLSGVTLSTFADPFVIRTPHEEITYLDYCKRFDVIDCNGNGVLFGNSESKLTDILSSSFGGDFTRRINQKLLGFASNITNIETSDIQSVDDLGQLLGVESNNFSVGIPTEIQDVLKLGSIRYEDIFGYVDLSEIYSLENVGNLLTTDDIVSSGEILFTRPLNDDNEDFEVFVVNTQTGLSSLEDSLIGNLTYTVGSIDHPVYDPNIYCFWRSNFDGDLQTVGNMYNTNNIPFIPTKEEWLNIIERKIEYNLIRNLLF